MRVARVIPLAAALVVLSLSPARAQSGDPTGHWAGSIQTPTGTEVAIELDVTKGRQGFSATYNNPTEKVQAMPLLGIVVTGKAVTVQVRKDGVLKGDLSADGQTFSGSFIQKTPAGAEVVLPFTLKRAGAAKVEPTPTNPAIPNQFAGIWDGLLEVNGFKVSLKLNLGNQGNGAVGTLTNLFRGEAPLPLVEIAAKGEIISFRVKAVGNSYSGTINAAGSEIVGNLTAPDATVRPLTFKRATAAASN